MNEFTKEELSQLMEACVNWFECPDEGIMQEAHDLVGKLKSMIDNYCEHDYRTSNESHFKCQDCGEREI